MTVSERVVVLMSPREKAALDAKTAGRMSAGELVRRAVEAYDGDAAREAEELKGLLAVFSATHAETLRRLERTEKKLDEVLTQLDSGVG